MNIEKRHDGAFVISDIIHQERVVKVYIGFTLKQAKRHFMQYCNQISKSWQDYLAI